MNINEAFEYLNFWISKERGSFYTIPQLEQLVDRGQISLYEDLQPKYATSQRIKDALAPFKSTYNFTTQVSGYVIVPSNLNYLNLLAIQVYFNISNTRTYAAVQLVNEDEIANRLNSQIDPVTVTSPIGEQVGQQTFRLYPINSSGYNGNISFLRRPIAPVFGYSVISGRVIVYNPVTSTQLEWSEEWMNLLLLKALRSIGINLTDASITQWAEARNQENYNVVNML